MNSLKDVDRNLPFTGSIEVDFTVVCADPDDKENYYSEGSIFAKSKEDYIKQCKRCHITPNKEYKVVKIIGVGDVFDVVIINDLGTKIELMDTYFRDTKSQKVQNNFEVEFNTAELEDFSKKIVDLLFGALQQKYSSIEIPVKSGTLIISVKESK